MDTPTPATSQAADVRVPRVRRCIGDPPRQIEDPQSPPCVPYWSGDNGGATYKGVTRDEIRIKTPGYDFSQTPGYHADLQAFFNKRFEFYGRHITLLPNNVSGGTPAEQQASAAEVDEQ